MTSVMKPGKRKVEAPVEKYVLLKKIWDGLTVTPNFYNTLKITQIIRMTDKSQKKIY